MGEDKPNELLRQKCYTDNVKPVTILFLRRDGEILLAMKKRGFGAGKWNGVGGKVEQGETILEAVIRECQEEIGVTPLKPKFIGKIKFYEKSDPEFCNNASIFVTTSWRGEPRESEEMRPQWFSEVQIPYDQMWTNDYLWIPLMLANKPFAGSVTLDGEQIVYHDIKEVNNPEEQR